MIPIQTEGSRPPLFCITRPNINALGFVFLARNLGNDQPVYGLQKQMAEDPDIFMTPRQYHALAAEYIKEVQKYSRMGHTT